MARPVGTAAIEEEGRVEGAGLDKEGKDSSSGEGLVRSRTGSCAGTSSTFPPSSFCSPRRLAA